MEVSLGPFITCFLTVLFLTVYVFVTIYVKKDVLYDGMKIVFLLISIILVRMLVPFNFPFTITIPSYKVLPPIDRFLFSFIGGTGIELAQVLFGIWLVVTMAQILRMILRQQKFRSYLRPFRVKDLTRYPRLYQVLRENDVADLPVYIVPINISPAIVGVFRPVFVLPRQEFSDRELYYICQHEIRHYRNHDLWLKLFIDLVLCAQWFNPAAYFLNKQLTLVFELSNDQGILASCSELQRMEYTECILKVAESRQKNTSYYVGLSFVDIGKSDLEMRTNYIVSEKYRPKKGRFLSMAAQYVLMAAVLVASFMIVPEGSSMQQEVEETTLGITPENSYIVKSESEYLLFVDGNYMFSLLYIPEEFAELPVYEEEDMR